MTEPVRPLEALIAKWRLDAEDGLEDSDTLIECADELAALLQAAAPPAPTAEPVNWKASYHQACDDADAYKADAEKRLVKMEQNWRSCQHEIAYLRELLKERRAAQAERVSEGKELCEEHAYHPRLFVVCCTREKGHAGDHIAAIGPYREGEAILKQWAAETP